MAASCPAAPPYQRRQPEHTVLYWCNKAGGSVFTADQMVEFASRATMLNEQRDSDTVCCYLRQPIGAAHNANQG